VDFRASFAPSDLRAVLPPVDFRAVCFVRAIENYLVPVAHPGDKTEVRIFDIDSPNVQKRPISVALARASLTFGPDEFCLVSVATKSKWIILPAFDKDPVAFEPDSSRLEWVRKA
jgi:hypothetical protein